MNPAELTMEEVAAFSGLIPIGKCANAECPNEQPVKLEYDRHTLCRDCGLAMISKSYGAITN